MGSYFKIAQKSTSLGQANISSGGLDKTENQSFQNHGSMSGKAKNMLILAELTMKKAKFRKRNGKNLV